MQVATWNVNSVRARLPRLLEWLESKRPEVVCLQETKCVDGQFPHEPIEELGYNIATFGQKTYNGVAILSKSPIEDVVRGVPSLGDDQEARVIGAQIQDLCILDLYVVNGHEVGSDKFAYKLDWMQQVSAFMAERYDMGEKVIVTGDFNVTFDDRDVYDPVGWHEKIHCSTPEREALRHMMAPGFVDGLRCFNQNSEVYTWWDFRTRGFQQGRGLRIDHFLLSEPALEACRGIEVDLDARGGEKPSDHAPLIATFE